MPTATLERPSFPKTVSACHVEIIRLRVAVEDAVGDSDRIKELEAEVEELRDRIKATEAENDQLEERIEELEDDQNPDAVEAIENFLYEVERPPGQFKFDVIHGPATDRAIIRLFDAVGRRP